MSFSINQLSSLAKLASTNPNAAKTIIKLASIDVLKSLGGDKYSIVVDSKTLTAQSEKPLSEGSKYWAQLTSQKETPLKLSNLLKMPQLLKNFQSDSLKYSLKDLSTILNSKNPAGVMKQNLLEALNSASSKEEFTSASNLLLSLQNQTFTIPLSFHNYFSILQFKKRYNKKTKKSQIDFYAALELLGPVSGLIILDMDSVTIELNVAYEKTKNFLENEMKNLSYDVNISLLNQIEPLYNANINSLLDVNI